jgi:hypothetical protein
MDWYRQAQQAQPEPAAEQQILLGPVDVAMVGSTGSSLDSMATELLAEWLKENDPPMAQRGFNLDHINLSQGRDFLTESQTYDVVILCHIYSGETGRDNQAFHAMSPHHSRQEWARRLSQTQAKYIITFGLNEADVIASWIGAIPGYRMAGKFFQAADLYIRL